MLNKAVKTVLFGLTRPFQATQIVHGSAAILGLPLLKEYPATTLVITGMRKTNDLAQGQHVIRKAFQPFGEIEEAATNNRGFGKQFELWLVPLSVIACSATSHIMISVFLGFVRFAKAKSVQRALERYRKSEIEIQDVSVSIKVLKSESPP